MTFRLMQFENSEASLNLTIAALSNVLNIKDQEFLARAMRSYAALMVSEQSNQKKTA